MEVNYTMNLLSSWNVLCRIFLEVVDVLLYAFHQLQSMTYAAVMEETEQKETT